MLRLLLLVTTQTQALRMPLRPLRITHVHRAVAAPTTPTTADARPNALLFPVLTVAAAALGRAAPQTVAASLGTKAAFRRGLLDGGVVFALHHSRVEAVGVLELLRGRQQARAVCEGMVASVPGTWGKAMRGAVRNKER